MKKENIIDVSFDINPEIQVRIICKEDTKKERKEKKKYPFELKNGINVTVKTTKREFIFDIVKGYRWNGADIPRIFWRMIGSRTDNDFLVASMVHDYLIEFKKYILEEILKNSMTIAQYRRLTSLIFRTILKQQGNGNFKSNMMAFFVDIYQIINKRGWQCS